MCFFTQDDYYFDPQEQEHEVEFTIVEDSVLQLDLHHTHHSTMMAILYATETTGRCAF